MTYNKTKQAVLDSLEFRAKDHRYLMDGFRIPSVTQVIDQHLPFDKGMPQEIREAALLRGDLVHKLTQRWDTRPGDGLTTMSWAVEVNLSGYLEAWIRARTELGFEIVYVEQRVYHRKHRFSGTYDREVIWEDAPTVLEIKSGPLYPEYAWQTAAYKLAANDGREGAPITRRLALQLKADGTFFPQEHKDKADESAFLGALAIANWRSKYGKN